MTTRHHAALTSMGVIGNERAVPPAGSRPRDSSHVERWRCLRSDLVRVRCEFLDDGMHVELWNCSRSDPGCRSQGRFGERDQLGILRWVLLARFVPRGALGCLRRDPEWRSQGHLGERDHRGVLRWGAPRDSCHVGALGLREARSGMPISRAPWRAGPTWGSSLGAAARFVPRGALGLREARSGMAISRPPWRADPPWALRWELPRDLPTRALGLCEERSGMAISRAPWRAGPRGLFVGSCRAICPRGPWDCTRSDPEWRSRGRLRAGPTWALCWVLPRAIRPTRALGLLEKRSGMPMDGTWRPVRGVVLARDACEGRGGGPGWRAGKTACTGEARAAVAAREALSEGGSSSASASRRRSRRAGGARRRPDRAASGARRPSRRRPRRTSRR